MMVQAVRSVAQCHALLFPATKLLQDPEAEVRTAATFNFAHVAKCKAIPVLLKNRPPQTATTKPCGSACRWRNSGQTYLMLTDDSEHVRAAWLGGNGTGANLGQRKDANTWSCFRVLTPSKFA
jgi:hypothetical protein